jgi:hypothetical protein
MDMIFCIEVASITAKLIMRLLKIQFLEDSSLKAFKILEKYLILNSSKTMQTTLTIKSYQYMTFNF